MESQPIPICFAQMERDLYAALETDTQNQLENEAKLRAVSQRASYEEFRDLVRTAHLKPANISGSGKPTRTRIWNNLALNKRSSHHDPPDYTETQRNKSSAQANSTHLASNQIPSGSSQFLTCWQQSDAPARLSLLYKMGPSGLSQIFSIDMPTALLGEIFEALLGFAPTVEGVATVVRLLDALTRVRRFSLVVHFLNTEEKAVCQHLINKLLASLVSREQDLAEIGITEWSIQELGNKFLVKI